MSLRKNVICGLALLWMFSAFSMDLNDGLVMHFNFKDANNKPEIVDSTGKVKCISRQKVLVVQEDALRIAPGAEIYIPAKYLPKITDACTINVWLVKGYFGDISPVLFKGIHADSVQFLLSIGCYYPEFCYKNEPGQKQWKGIHYLGSPYGQSIRYADNGWAIPGKEVKINPGYWTMLSVVFDHGSIKIFLNGQLVLSKISASPEILKHNDFPLYIGAERIPKEKLNYRTGNLLINDLRLYNKTLTNEEINALFLAEKLKYPQKNVIPSGAMALKPCNEYLVRTLEGYDPEFKNKLKLTADYERDLPAQPCIAPNSMKSMVKPSNGQTGLFINGTEQYPVLFYPILLRDNRYLFDTALPAIRDFAAAGIDLFGTGGIAPIFWLGKDKYDFAQIDNIIRQELAANPQGKLQVQFYLRPHGWFFSEHNEELERYYSGMNSQGEPKPYFTSAPLGSKIWIECSSKLVYDVVKYIEKQDYADRIFGYHIAAGDAGEWYWAASFTGGIPGYSKATRKSFQLWLRNKYKSDDELQKAWNNRKITIASAEVPTPEFRMTTEKFIFRDPVQARQALDYREYMIDITYENILQSCKALKEASDFKKTLTIYAGYPLLYAGKQATMHLGGLQHLSKVFRSQYVDGIATPLDYNKRRGGDPGANINAFNGSAILHNKLLWHENDLRTHLHPEPVFGRTGDLQESLTVIKRGFGQSLVLGAGFWWYALDNNSMFHQENMMQTIARIGKLALQSIGQDRSSVAEVALIFDERSTLYTSVPKDNFVEHHTWGAYLNAFRMGAPFDMYLLDDLDNSKMPDYKLYIMMNTYYTDNKTREMIKNKLRRKNAVIVWCYAPGWITPDGFDAKAMESLTGFKFKVSEEQVKLQLSVNDKNHAITRLADKMESYQVGPVFKVDDPEAKILGMAGGMPALAVKENENCRMVYTLMPLTVELLQGLCDYAGVDVYCRSNDIFIMNKSYIMLHTSTAGDKTIQLQGKYNVEELFSGKKMGQSTSQIIDKNLPAQETRIYHISQ